MRNQLLQKYIYYLNAYCVFNRSLGVLLYTLVYGAMPFDGSNFKRLVKQITTGDYYEPKQPSSKTNNIPKTIMRGLFFEINNLCFTKDSTFTKINLLN